MKRNHKKILFLFLTIISLNVYCQDSIVGLYLYDIKQDSIVECRHLYYGKPNTRILYGNFDYHNDFLISSLDFEIYATCEGAKLTKVEKVEKIADFFYTPVVRDFLNYTSFFYDDDEEYANIKFYSMSNIKSDTVSIFVYKKEDSTLVKQFDYEYKKYQYFPPKAQLGYLSDSLVTVNDVLMQNELIAFFDSSYLFSSYLRILNYHTKIISNNETFYFGKFDNYLKGFIKDLKPGSKIIFYYIDVVTPSSFDGILPNIEYTIIE